MADFSRFDSKGFKEFLSWFIDRVELHCFPCLNLAISLTTFTSTRLMYLYRNRHPLNLSLDYLCLANWVHLGILHLTNLSET